MRICFIADGRSPIAIQWIRYLVENGHDVHLISSYPCSEDAIIGAKIDYLSLGLTQFSQVKHDGSIISDKAPQGRAWKKFLKPILAQVRSGKLSFLANFLVDWLIPIDLYRQQSKLKARILAINPDLVHAMRISREGIATALATPIEIPLLLSAWGNDFTLWAERNPLRAMQTRHALARTDALHTDCHRDIRLAEKWGLDISKPTLVVPGAGGVKLNNFSNDKDINALKNKYGIAEDALVLLNPRGIRKYVYNELFFKALADVVQTLPNIHVLCTGMHNNPVVEKWVRTAQLDKKVSLLPLMPHAEMTELYALADISISLSDHDGTPNSLLEAMASGCFIVAGDVESIREWIDHEKNGLIVDVHDITSVIAGLKRAIEDNTLRQNAASINRHIIEDQADYNKIMNKVMAFYQHLCST